MMNKMALANAAAVTVIILWIVCSALVAGLPAMMLDMSGHMLHVDMQAVGWALTPVGFVVGLVIWAVSAWVTGWLIAYFYNRFNREA